jgi:hypothetical protein
LKRQYPPITLQTGGGYGRRLWSRVSIHAPLGCDGGLKENGELHMRLCIKLYLHVLLFVGADLYGAHRFVSVLSIVFGNPVEEIYIREAFLISAEYGVSN